MKRASLSTLQRGFTIVELLIVIVVIAILAAITVVSYNSISNRAKQSAAASAAEQAAKKVLNYSTLNAEQFPVDLPTGGVNNDANTTFEYSYDNTAKTYCITATFQKVSYYVSNANATPVAGLCPGHTGGAPIADGSIIQTITAANCPSSRTRAVDARDNRTYWVQKLLDGKCWMLTNLAYAGGGVNTYNDTRSITQDLAVGSGGSTTAAGYYIPTNANPTTEPTPPSTSTDGGVTNPQYGYLYNWCAAMGAPIATDPNPTAACSSAATPNPDVTRSICPAGWRLPTDSPSTGEFTALNTAINGGATNTDAGLRTGWLAQRGGFWNGGYGQVGTVGYYASSTQWTAAGSYYFGFGSSSVSLAAGGVGKSGGFAVRCVAN